MTKIALKTHHRESPIHVCQARQGYDGPAPDETRPGEEAGKQDKCKANGGQRREHGADRRFQGDEASPLRPHQESILPPLPEPPFPNRETKRSSPHIIDQSSASKREVDNNSFLTTPRANRQDEDDGAVSYPTTRDTTDTTTTPLGSGARVKGKGTSKMVKRARSADIVKMFSPTPNAVLLPLLALLRQNAVSD